MPLVKINDVNICYEIYGEGAPVVMVEGYSAKKENWIAQIKPLSQHFKIIVLDNRGTGKSDRPDYPYTMDMFADDIDGLMEFLKIEKAHIIGKSLGGMIVQSFALKYPHRINKIVLINTTGTLPVNPEEGIKMLVDGYIEYYHASLDDPARTFFKKSVQEFDRKFRKKMEEDPKHIFYGLFSAEDLIRESTIDITTPRDLKNQASAFVEFNALDKLHNIKNSTLILCAEKDRLLPVMMSEKIHEKLPNSVLKVIKGAGHNSNLEKAPEVNQSIVDFLKN